MKLKQILKAKKSLDKLSVPSNDRIFWIQSRMVKLFKKKK